MLKILLLSIIVLACCISGYAQKTVPGLSPEDTVHTKGIHKSDSIIAKKANDTVSNNTNAIRKTIKDIQVLDEFEIAGGIGWGNYGYTYPFFIRYKHISIGFVIPFEHGSDIIRSTIDRAPRDNDYTLIKAESNPLIFSIEYYFLVRENFYVFPSIGFSRKQVEIIPKDNRFNIYYKPESKEEVFAFCYGGGVEYYIPLDERVSLGFQAAHRNIIGSTLSLGIAFPLYARYVPK